VAKLAHHGAHSGLDFGGENEGVEDGGVRDDRTDVGDIDIPWTWN